MTPEQKQAIRERLEKANRDKRPLKEHFGCKNPPACSVCTAWNSAHQEWEAYLMDLRQLRFKRAKGETT